MGLFSSKKSKNKYATVTSKSKLSVDIIENNQWKKCNKCNEIIYNEDLKNNLNICPKCGNYFRLTAFERIELLIDDDTFIEEVIFEPDKNINLDDLKANDGYDLEYQLYIANHCDVRVHISAIDGRIFIEERDKDNNMIEYSLFELSQKNKQ